MYHNQGCYNTSEKTKKHFLGFWIRNMLHKKIKRSIANKSNRNAETISLRFLCSKKGVLS